MVPSRTKFVTYFRVSTQRQGRSGLGLEAQQHAVRQYVSQHGGWEIATYTEIESGRYSNRPQLARALQRCRQTRATLLVAKLDRLSRDGEFLYRLQNDSVQFQALDIPEANTLTLGVMIAMAQHEREIISQRTRAALAARKAQGKKLGTPRDLSAYQARASALGSCALHAKALARAREVAPAIEEARAAGHTTLLAIAAYLNGQSITTPRGKSWTATAVRNVLLQLETATEADAA